MSCEETVEGPGRRRVVEAAIVVLIALTVGGAVLVRFTGLPLHALGPPAGFAILVLSGVAMLAVLRAQVGLARAAGTAVAVFLACSAAEVCGLLFGVPFGEYRYTDRWQPVLALPNGKLFPILLPIAWFILIYCAHQLARTRLGGMAAALMTGKLVSSIDLALEPAMTGPVDFWKWEAPNPYLAAPWTNAVGWFLVGAVGGLILNASGVRPNYAAGAWRFLLIVVLCTMVIGFTHGEPRVAWGIPVSVLIWAYKPDRKAKTLSGNPGSPSCP